MSHEVLHLSRLGQIDKTAVQTGILGFWSFGPSAAMVDDSDFGCELGTERPELTEGDIEERYIS